MRFSVSIDFAQVVSSKDGLWLSVAITLGMALIIGTARPFVQPQVNVLQTTSFACPSSVSLVGFGTLKTILKLLL